MVDDFTEHPTSITEVKADRSHNAADWTPRDVLINTLRDLDSGKLKADALVVCMRLKNDDGGMGHHWACSAPDLQSSLGLLERTSYRMQQAAD